MPHKAILARCCRWYLLAGNIAAKASGVYNNATICTAFVLSDYTVIFEKLGGICRIM